MRYLLIAAAFLLLPAVVPTEAEAAGPRQGIQIVNNNYVSNNNYNVGPHAYRGGYDHAYRGGYDYGYQPSRYRGHSSRSFEGHNEAVARIQAAHSRYRTTYHPRSNYNSPPYYERQRW